MFFVTEILIWGKENLKKWRIEIKPFDSRLLKIDEKYHRLMLIVESTRQNLGNTINIVLTNQNIKERLEKANEV